MARESAGLVQIFGCELQRRVIATGMKVKLFPDPVDVLTVHRAHHEQSEQVTTLPLCVFVQTIARFIEMVQLRALVTVFFAAGSLPQAGIGFSILNVQS